MSDIVRDYIPRPMRCYNCQKFGHVASRCRGNADVHVAWGTMGNVKRGHSQGVAEAAKRVKVGERARLWDGGKLEAPGLNENLIIERKS